MIQEELIARESTMVDHFRRLPKPVAQHPRVEQLRAQQYDYLSRMLSFKRPLSIGEGLERFDEELRATLGRDSETRCAVGTALAELYAQEQLGEADQRRLDSHLDAMFSARISTRFLVKHYLACKSPREGWSGSIQQRCAPAERCELAASAVSSRCLERYSTAPQLLVHADREQAFAFVPEHMDVVLREVIMNAAKATVRRHEGTGALPPVRIVAATGMCDVTIKIADEGGGLPRSKLGRVWSYQGRWKAHGGGLGLPIARLYAKYFGGSLHLTPVEGYGTDCYVTFPIRPDASCKDLLSSTQAKPSGSRATSEFTPGAGLFDAQARRFE